MEEAGWKGGAEKKKGGYGVKYGFTGRLELVHVLAKYIEI